MSRVANDLVELPLHVQAVYFRQFAREAEWLGHMAGNAERDASYQLVARYWRAVADKLDVEEDYQELSDIFGRCIEAHRSF